jgi:hypothetical protein
MTKGKVMIEKDGWRIEQHVGTIMQALVVGLLAWSLKTNVETSAQIGVLQVEMRALQVVVNQGTADRYRGIDAARDMSVVWGELNRHSARIEKLESRR